MLAVVQLEYAHRHTLDECPVGRTQIAKGDRRVRHRDLAMMRGDGRVIDREVIALAAPDAIQAGLEFDLPSLGRSRIDEKAIVHGLNSVERTTTVYRGCTGIVTSKPCHMRVRLRLGEALR